MSEEKQQYIVQKTQQEVPGVVTLFLTNIDGTVPRYSAGQFINVYFPESNTPEGKAYSISCEPGLPTFSITVRGIGEFSNKLCAMRHKDTVIASLPYGFFNPANNENDLVLIAGGIGITPFRSIIGDIATRHPDRKVSLFHSIRTAEDAVFRNYFVEVQKTMPNFSFIHYITQESTLQDDKMIAGHITASDICNQIAINPTTEFLICGSISFVRDLWKGLRDHGVSEEAVYTEAFFSH